MATKSPYYRAIGKEEEVFRSAYKCKLPLLLKGPTGCGKTRLVEKMANELSTRLVQVVCNEDTSATDLLGRYLLKGGDTIWQEGPVTRAVREGHFLYLDEIAEAREDVVVLLHSLSDHRRQLFLDRSHESIAAPDAFQLIISFNPGYQTRMRRLKPSTRQRFVSLELSYPPVEIETEILAAETGANLSLCKSLAQLALRIRNMSELQLDETVSTRLLVNTALLIKQGLAPRLSADVGIVQALTDDLEVAQPLKDLVSLHL
ncbi:MAG: AAA family ATPase [Deltaproteobacteria bacterium CG11_big_fil_rev_8_21_14_0_20_45_16]|nr:MAG: AAA family ATPase [Deltaproteobacteria bacterium CG11_big_fil_rev_8_21_14_0_20_45_16]